MARQASRTAASCLFLIVCVPLHCFMAEGRAAPKYSASASSPTHLIGEAERMLKGGIGSRPPKCETVCNECRKCEAVQVPTNYKVDASELSTIRYARGGVDDSNYKPMSWKCKCGSLILDP